MPQPSSRARSPSPDPHSRHQRSEHEVSLEEIPPLAYDSLAELEDMFARWRDELKKDTGERWAALGGRKTGQTMEQAQQEVLEEFFEPVIKVVLSNCTIGGMSYADYLQRMPDGETEPFDDELHYRVVEYQNSLFEAREDNVNARRNEPNRIAKNLDSLIEQDEKHLDAIVNAPKPRFAPQVATTDPAQGKKKGRKSVSAAAASSEGPTAAQARDDFEAAREDLGRLLKSTVALNAKAEGATQVARDASALA